MIPNIVRGSQPIGLMSYLAGQGRHNEHTEQHLIAGEGIDAWRYEDTMLSAQDARDIGKLLDDPARLNNVSIKQGHIWHCSLSVPKEDGVLDDDEWRNIAEQFLHRMGLDDADGTKAPIRWAAIRHGQSREGNDHIHIVVNLVREDGTKVFLRHDYQRAQQVCRDLEREYALTQVGNDIAQCATRGYKAGELEARARRRAKAKFTHENNALDWRKLPPQEKARLIAQQLHHDQPREALALRIRATAVRSQNEAEFVRRLRGQGVLIRPRFAAHTTDVVTGYSVAEKPVYGEKPIWYGGGTVARDLSLTRLRASCGWTDSIIASQEASDEWLAAFKGRRVVHPRADEQVAQPKEVADAIAKLNDRLRMIPVDDRSTWAQVAQETAGALASWSRAVEPLPGPIARAAITLSRSAQTYRKPDPAAVHPRHAMSEAALAFSLLAVGGRGTVSSAIMFRQLFRTTLEIRAAMQARGEAYQAQSLLRVQEQELMQIAGQLPSADYVDAPSAEVSAEKESQAGARAKTYEHDIDAMVNLAHATPIAVGIGEGSVAARGRIQILAPDGTENQPER